MIHNYGERMNFIEIYGHQIYLYERMISWDAAILLNTRHLSYISPTPRFNDADCHRPDRNSMAHPNHFVPPYQVLYGYVVSLPTPWVVDGTRGSGIRLSLILWGVVMILV